MAKTRFQIATLFTPDRSVLREQLFSELLEESRNDLMQRYAVDPVVIGEDYLLELNRLCPILCKAIVKVVSAYFADERIRQIYQLHPVLEKALKLAAHRTYEPGFYRPDFLYDRNSHARICEIGSRYPLNGWMISYYQNLIYEQLYDLSTTTLEVISAQKQVLNVLIDLWDLSLPVGCIHDEEKGTEILFVKRELLRSGGSCISVRPQDLELRNGAIVFQNLPLNQFILEIDREELGKFKPEVLDQLVRQGNYFNDVRTLILVHDKRILSVFWNEDIMRDYLSEEEYAFLKPYLIPSFVIKNEEEIDPYLYGTQNLILKLNSGGRGIGAYLKNDCYLDEWESVLRNHWKHYMIQHFVDQEVYEIGGLSQYLVGMLLCRNDQHFGPGLFRGSAESVVNVYQGRARIFPVLLQKRDKAGNRNTIL